MKSPPTIEAEIRELLQKESSAIALSNTLFTPDGLFAKLATTESERRALVESPLFKEAQRRLSSLQRQEARSLANAAASIDRSARGDNTILRMESA